MTILCVGTLKEKWLREGCAEYVKRLSRYGGVEIIEAAEQSAPDKPSRAQLEKLMELEGRAILARVKPGDRLIALAIGGALCSSEELAARLEVWRGGGRRPVLVIGGSYGLAPEVLARADETLSLSRLTFTHQISRLLLLEQLYRASNIIAGGAYHK